MKQIKWQYFGAKMTAFNLYPFSCFIFCILFLLLFVVHISIRFVYVFHFLFIKMKQIKWQYSGGQTPRWPHLVYILSDKKLYDPNQRRLFTPRRIFLPSFLFWFFSYSKAHTVFSIHDQWYHISSMKRIMNTSSRISIRLSRRIKNQTLLFFSNRSDC